MFVALAVLVIVAQATGSDVSLLCPGTVPLERVPDTGEGTWWTVAATNMSSGHCGVNNNQPPCSCTGFKFSSDMSAPRIPTYNTTMFGYNETTCEKQEALISLVDETQPWAIFYLIDKSTGTKTVVSALDTDNHKNYIIFYICGAISADGKAIVYIVAKNKHGLCAESQKKVDEVLKKNNISKDSLIKFDPKSCTNI